MIYVTVEREYSRGGTKVTAFVPDKDLLRMPNYETVALQLDDTSVLTLEKLLTIAKTISVREEEQHHAPS